MAKKDTIKIDGIEIEDHKTVSFATALILVLIAFTAGVLAYHYIFKILPTTPGCVQIMAKTTGGNPIPNANVEIYVAVVINATGEKVASGKTGPSGKVKFCGMFQPNTEYKALIYDEAYVNQIWAGSFTTNERSTADFPVIVREEIE